MDLDRYLARIDYRGPRAADAEALSALHRAHARAIPFENLDILLGRPIRVDLDGVMAKLVDARRGGYCFEQNSLFAAALRALGFAVTTLAARVRWLAPAEVTTPRTHMLLRVDLPDGPRLADVGFGGLGLTEPLRLTADLEQPTELDTYRLRASGGRFTLEARAGADWLPLYQFTLEEHHPIDYVVANHYTSTHPDSHFRKGPVVARPDRGVRYSLRGREHAVRRGGDIARRIIDDDDELLAVLARDFGLSFPPGTRFAP
jgi:N-hydroxyarylamine O-acetyltransferase